VFADPYGCRWLKAGGHGGGAVAVVHGGGAGGHGGGCMLRLAGASCACAHAQNTFPLQMFYGRGHEFPGFLK
jgi:hypothetical protein